MPRRLLDVPQVEALIRAGEPLVVAGEEALLARLPAGRWIGGTGPYFMTEEGGTCDRTRLFAERLPAGAAFQGIRRYSEEDVARVYAEIPAGAIAVMLVPFMSRVHAAFALDAPAYEGFAAAPLFGWVAGVHLSELGRVAPKVFDGTRGEALGEGAVVLHLSLPPGAVAELAILNIFERGDGPAIVFPETSFLATTAEIGGVRRNLAEYVRDAGLDTRLPLVADYFGAPVNVAFLSVDPERREVRFFAPVFAGVPYRHARAVGDYVHAFGSAMPVGVEGRVAFSCNCVLNYVHSALEGRRTAIGGPITFGEIAYQLLNQTLVYLTVTRGPPDPARPA